MGRDGISVIDKAARILGVFVDAGAGALPFSEIQSRAGMSAASTHRVLGDMVRHGLISQHARRDEYRLGPVLISVGVLAAHQSDVRQIAAPYLDELRDRSGETVILAELHGDAVVPVLRADGLHELRMNQQVGRRYPAYAGATGKVLLAHLGDAALGRYLERVGPEPLTSQTVTDVAVLRKQLHEIRRVGVAASRGERVAEAIAISAPVFDGTGDVVAALTISGVAGRFDEAAMVARAQLVKDFGDRMSADLGHRPSGGAGRPTAAALRDPASPEHERLTAMCRRAWSGGDPQPLGNGVRQ